MNHLVGNAARQGPRYAPAAVRADDDEINALFFYDPHYFLVGVSDDHLARGVHAAVRKIGDHTLQLLFLPLDVLGLMIPGDLDNFCSGVQTSQVLVLGEQQVLWCHDVQQDNFRS